MSRRLIGGSATALGALVVLIGLLSPGCGREEAAAPEQPPVQVPSQGSAVKEGAVPEAVPVQSAVAAKEASEVQVGTGSLERAMALWNEGKRTEAVQQFLLVDWTKKPLFPPDSILGMTEEEFRKLASTSAAQQIAKSAEIQNALRPLQDIVGAVLQAGRDAVAAGDVSSGERYFRALLQFGESLVNNPDVLEILRTGGKGFVSMASEELEKLNR